MAVYSVFEPVVRNDGMAAHAERFAFVRDGFTFSAFLFGPFWILWHRLWLGFLAYVVAVGILGAILHATQTPGPGVIAVVILVELLLGLEATSLRRWTLLRRGWRDHGIVLGDDRQAAEARFFERWVANEESPHQPAPAAVRSGRAPQAPASDVIGLFPEPGANR